MENRSDFLVLGGGMIGSSAAYYLSRAGASVTVLERGDTAFGTAGASGGSTAARRGHCTFCKVLSPFQGL